MFNVCRQYDAKAWSLEITQLRTAALPIYTYFIKYVIISSSQWHFKKYYLAPSITYSELHYGKSDHSEKHTHTISFLVIRQYYINTHIDIYFIYIHLCMYVCIYILSDNWRVFALCQVRNFITVSFKTQNNPLTYYLFYQLFCIISVMEWMLYILGDKADVCSF